MDRQIFNKKLKSLDLIDNPPFGFVFESNESFYFYDTVSSEIIRISLFMKELIRALLKKSKALRLRKLNEIDIHRSEEKILEGLKIINLKRKNENLLNPCPRNFNINLKDQSHPKEANFFQLVIEITQSCNMICKYCIYGKNYSYERKYSSSVISKIVVFKALKYFLYNSGHPEPNITFFGGEPLLNQNLIDDSIKYAKKINPKTRFLLTTNGLLLNPTYFDFIRKHQIRVGVSFDGPKNIHDSYRVLPGGKGTFDIIKKNIDKLYQIDPDYIKSNFTILVTLSDIRNLDIVSNFLINNYIFNGLNVTINKIRLTGIKENMDEFNNQVPKYKYLKFLLNEYAKDYDKKGFKLVSAKHAYFSPLLRLILKRKPLIRKYIFSKICTLGDWRLFVDVKGNFRICEKTDRLPIIGNINRGIDWELLENMRIEFLSSCESCRNCWAIGLCNVCWVDIYNKHGKVDKGIKKHVCETKLKEYEIGLMAFMTLTEKYGDSFKIVPPPQFN